MRKLMLEDLEVTSFSTTPQPRKERGTVLGNEWAEPTWDCPNTRWNCSIDFCSHGCPLTTVGQTTHNTE